MKDGAHTHNSSPGPGIAAALTALAAIALASGAASALAAVFSALLIGLAVFVAVAVVGLVTCLIIVHRRPVKPLPVYRPTRLARPPLENREVVRLRQAITDLQAQLIAARVPAPHLGCAECTAHRHVHFHGIDPGQIAAIVAASTTRREGESR